MAKATVNRDKMRGIQIKGRIRNRGPLKRIKKAFVRIDRAYTKFYYKHGLSVGCSIKDVSRTDEGENRKEELGDLMKELLELKAERARKLLLAKFLSGQRETSEFRGAMFEADRVKIGIIKVIDSIGKIADLSAKERGILSKLNATDYHSTKYYKEGVECIIDTKTAATGKLWRWATEKLIQTRKDVGERMGGEVLDAGCGVGGFVKLLSERYGSNAYGIDIGPCACLMGKLLGVKNLSIGSIAETPFKKNTFDVIFSLDTLFTILDEIEEKAAVKETLRILKDNGYLITNRNLVEEKADEDVREISSRFGLEIAGRTAYLVAFKKSGM